MQKRQCEYIYIYVAEYFVIDKNKVKTILKWLLQFHSLIESRSKQTQKYFNKCFTDLNVLCRTTLARWRAAQEGGGQQQKSRRPYLASECEDLREAEKWRNQVISEVARKVSQIQNGECVCCEIEKLIG